MMKRILGVMLGAMFLTILVSWKSPAEKNNIKIKIVANGVVEPESAFFLNIFDMEGNALYKDLENKNGRFTVYLTKDEEYRIVLNQECHQQKEIILDTHIPQADLELKYALEFNLKKAIIKRDIMLVKDILRVNLLDGLTKPVMVLAD